MLLNILDETMAKAAKYEKLTKSSKFSNICGNFEKRNQQEEEILMLQKISEYVKKEETKDLSEENKEVSEYITENTDRVVKIFSLKDRPSTGLPFFRSIQYKLSESFGA